MGGNECEQWMYITDKKKQTFPLKSSSVPAIDDLSIITNVEIKGGRSRTFFKQQADKKLHYP